MKRIIVLALAACMVLGAAFSASATEISAKGTFAVTYDSVQNDEGTDTNRFGQRFQPQIDIVASENLSATVQFRIQQIWGTDAPNATSLIQTRRAFVAFDLPMAPVHVTAGLQGIALPDAGWGNAIIDDNIYAATVAYSPVENISVTGIFGRLADIDDDTDTAPNATPAVPANNQPNERQDVYAVVVSANFDVVTLSPYFAYSNAYASEQNNGTVGITEGSIYWTGLVAKGNYAGFDLGAEAIYGSADVDAANTTTQNGWFFSAKADYTLDFAKVGATGWYSTSHGSDNVMPTISNADEFGPLVLFGGGLAQLQVGSDSLYGTLGTRGVALTASDISFIEKLSHGVAVGYLKSDNAALDAKVFEIDFVSSYALYEQLDLLFDFAYANIDSDRTGVADEDVLHFGAGVQYNF